ncbi:MAG: hypothetical protein JOS17DRAFT_743696 [Linnemannia elongata]|nr:MAG: hypothetical protein JOS17DRAFT_743696 [Linnemannia elongata]
MGEHHSDTTNDAAPPPAAVSLGKDSGDDDLASYIGGSLSPSFKAKVMISDSSNNNNNGEDCDVDMAMEGVELEVTSLAVQTTTATGMVPQLVQQSTTNDVLAVASTSTFFPSEPLLAAATADGAADTGVETELLREQASPPVSMTATASASTTTTTTPTTSVQAEQSELTKDTDEVTAAVSPPLGQNEDTDQTNPEMEEQEDDDEDDDSDGDNDDSNGLDEGTCSMDYSLVKVVDHCYPLHATHEEPSYVIEPSMIVTTDAIYSAVPMSSELHIFPHSSKGFNWNQDHFLKPHQRRNLGVDELQSAFNASIGGIVRSGSSSSTTSSTTNNSSSSTSASNTGGGMSAIRVHEIRLDQEESDQILPSHS